MVTIQAPKGVQEHLQRMQQQQLPPTQQKTKKKKHSEAKREQKEQNMLTVPGDGIQKQV